MQWCVVGVCLFSDVQLLQSRCRALSGHIVVSIVALAMAGVVRDHAFVCGACRVLCRHRGRILS
jgi:hypothetical protein